MKKKGKGIGFFIFCLVATGIFVVALWHAYSSEVETQAVNNYMVTVIKEGFFKGFCQGGLLGLLWPMLAVSIIIALCSGVKIFYAKTRNRIRGNEME